MEKGICPKTLHFKNANLSVTFLDVILTKKFISCKLHFKWQKSQKKKYQISSIQLSSCVKFLFYLVVIVIWVITNKSHK